MRSLLSVCLLMSLGCGGGPSPSPAPAPKPAVVAPAPAATPEPEVASPPSPDLATMDDAARLTYLMELGKVVYEKGAHGSIPCATCHQVSGKGLPPSFPPLQGQGEIMGSCTKHADYIINGLMGEMMIDGVKYAGVMPQQGNLTDLEIAAVITYERLSWGNTYGLCMPADVAAAR